MKVLKYVVYDHEDLTSFDYFEGILLGYIAAVLDYLLSGVSF